MKRLAARGPRAWRSVALLMSWLCTSIAGAEPVRDVDMASLTPGVDGLLRVYGSVGQGVFGVPVAAGSDLDGDGFEDVALAAMRATVLGRSQAGEVFLAFGDGSATGILDTAVAQGRILRIAGGLAREATGSEIWMDDVTGDGLGDLLVARQNHDPGGRVGAGALTIVHGSPLLRTLAESGRVLDLAAPPPGVGLTTLVGPDVLARLGIWMRTGDVTGDGVADLVVGADQVGTPLQSHRGAVYVVRGGNELAAAGTVDLSDPGASALAGHVARIRAPQQAREFHFGATCQIADLDGNGRGEVLVAAALNRSGATLVAPGATGGSAHGSGGAPGGRLFIAWDDNFEGNPWAPALSFRIDTSPGSRTVLPGGVRNVSFGEEILGGLDYDADGAADLFVGDIVGDASPQGDRTRAGSGMIFFDAGMLKGLEATSVDLLPETIRFTGISGGAAGDIAADTAAHGDFDGDGIDDLAVASPHADPLGRFDAGAFHVLHGRLRPWPVFVDLATGALPPPEVLEVTLVLGALGAGVDFGDTLGYSAATGDLDGDGRIDLVTNEMLGNGLAPGSTDTGNLVALSGELLAGGVTAAIRPFREGNLVHLLAENPFLVAILGSASLDVSQVDVTALAFGPAATLPVFDLSDPLVLARSRWDVNLDGRLDLLAWFDARETGLALADTRACLHGTAAGRVFEACDKVRVSLDECGLGFELCLLLPPLLAARTARRHRRVV